ncbi:MAG TPA: hypothetical protein VFT18_01545 [Gaiellaceae bacterium]|nr:hypothetical protein [Gaiellaceae bacterium]
MPSAPVRFALETAFVVLVAVGAALASLEPLVIIALTAVAAVLVALVERAFAREAARTAEATEPKPETPQHVERVEVEPEPVGAASEPELAVSERSARAILATSPPPVPEPVAERQPEAEPQPALEPEPEPEPEPEVEAVPERAYGGPPREWSLWDLERLVRENAGDRRQEEWGALILSLREFAEADGLLPVEFDDLVRESFGGLLAAVGAPEAAAAR